MRSWIAVSALAVLCVHAAACSLSPAPAPEPEQEKSANDQQNLVRLGGDGVGSIRCYDECVGGGDICGGACQQNCARRCGLQQ